MFLSFFVSKISINYDIIYTVINDYHTQKGDVNKDFKNINELKQAVFDWIWFYNHGRIKGKRKTIEIMEIIHLHNQLQH